MMDDVQSMADSSCSCLESDLHIFIFVVASVASVIALFDVLLRKFCQNAIRYFIIRLQRSMRLFFLNKVNTDSQSPVEAEHLL